MTAAPLVIESALFCRLLRRTRRHRLSLGKIQILTAIMAADDGCITTGQAAEITGTTAASITQLVDALEATGHLRRHHAASDRRCILLLLTEKGDAALTDILTA